MSHQQLASRQLARAASARQVVNDIVRLAFPEAFSLNKTTSVVILRPRNGVIYAVLSVCLSVCPSVRLPHNSRKGSHREAWSTTTVTWDVPLRAKVKGQGDQSHKAQSQNWWTDSDGHIVFKRDCEVVVSSLQTIHVIHADTSALYRSL